MARRRAIDEMTEQAQLEAALTEQTGLWAAHRQACYDCHAAGVQTRRYCDVGWGIAQLLTRYQRAATYARADAAAGQATLF